MEKLILKGAKVLFIEINDKDFGSSITIDVTNPEVRSKIESYYASEGISPKFKDYTNKTTGEVTKQYSIKLATFVKIQDESGNEYTLDEVEGKLAQIKLAFGAEVNLAIRSYEYDNKFGQGKSASVSALKVVKGAELKDDMSEL